MLTSRNSFHIGAPEDYDEWVVLQKGQEGADQWASKEFDKSVYVFSCLPGVIADAASFRYVRKFEKFTPSPEYPTVDASLRGSSGPVHSKSARDLQHNPMLTGGISWIRLRILRNEEIYRGMRECGDSCSSGSEHAKGYAGCQQGPFGLSRLLSVVH